MRMIDVFNIQKTPAQLMMGVAERAAKRRKALELTQAQLAQRADVSLGSLRRFEQTGRIAFESLVRICIALDCEDELDALFSKRAYTSIQEVIDAQESTKRR